MDLTKYSNPTPYLPPSARGYRQPWQPAVPSTLGMTRPVMQTVSHAGGLRTEDGGSEQGVDVKTTPATPIKKEESGSPTRRSGTD
jgi:hypothetical protein